MSQESHNPTESHVIVRFDPDLSSGITGEPAEASVTYEPGPDGEPVMVVTFGPIEPSGEGWLPIIWGMRSTVAPLAADDEDDEISGDDATGDRVQRFLTERGFDHLDAADALDVTVDELRDRLNGRPPFRSDEVVALADMLGVDIEHLIGGGER